MSSGFSGTATPEPTTGSTATDLLLGLTGRNKLLAAGDRLRELIIPDALASAVGATGSAKKSDVRSGVKQAMGKKEREELDRLIAAVCPLCEVCYMMFYVLRAADIQGCGFQSRQAVHGRWTR